MGEYARQYILENHGFDIGGDDDDEPRPKKVWKWACQQCGKKLTSERANLDHMRDMHDLNRRAAIRAKAVKTIPSQGTTPTT